MTHIFSRPICLLYVGVFFVLTACSGNVEGPGAPREAKYDRIESRGKLSGDGFSIGGGDDSQSGGQIGVNSFLWRATLDTLSFMPLASADPFGGVIITEWYEDPKTLGERFKVNAVILGQTLRADGVKVSLFKQKKDASGNWADQTVDPQLARQMEDTILTRARQLRVAQGK